MIRQNICPLCNHEASIRDAGYPYSIYEIECPVCGSYAITREAVDDIIDNPKFADSTKVSSYTRERTAKRQNITIYSEEPSSALDRPWATIHRIVDSFPKAISERLDKSLINLSKLSKFAGDEINITTDDYPSFYVESKESSLKEQSFILQQLIDDGYISGRTTFPGKFSITAKGWSKIYDLEKVPTPNSKQAFIAMWFDPSMDSASENGLKRAIRDAGYEPLKINDKEHTQKLTTR